MWGGVAMGVLSGVTGARVDDEEGVRGAGWVLMAITRAWEGVLAGVGAWMGAGLFREREVLERGEPVLEGKKCWGGLRWISVREFLRALGVVGVVMGEETREETRELAEGVEAGEEGKDVVSLPSSLLTP